MFNTGHARHGGEELPEFAFDPAARPELFEGVLAARALAFAIDAAIILVLTLIASVAVFFLGIFTFGLAWLLYGGIFPVIAVFYTAITLGGPRSATIGMHATGIEMRLWYGSRMYPLIAAMHALLFYFTVSLLTPLVLLVPLFNERRRCLHDMLIGTVVINTFPRRAAP